MQVTAFVAAGLTLSRSLGIGKVELLKQVTAGEAKRLEQQAMQVTTSLGDLHLGGFALGSEPCAVDVQNGRIIRIRPLHFDWEYDPSDINLPQINGHGATEGMLFQRPNLKSLPSYIALFLLRKEFTALTVSTIH